MMASNTITSSAETEEGGESMTTRSGVPVCMTIDESSRTSGVVVAYAEALAVVRLDPHREGAAEAAQARHADPRCRGRALHES